MKTLLVLPFFPHFSALRHPVPRGGASWFALHLAVWLLPLVCLSFSVPASTLPAGFTETQLAKGLDPTNLEVAPDGRIFVTEKNGKVHIIKNGALLATPFLSLTVDNFNERGLMSLIFDPDFARNGYVYVYYTVPRTASAAAHNRVSRFTASGDAALAGSERILLELDALQAGNHNGGALLFRDGKLLVASGENARASNSQSLNTLWAKSCGSIRMAVSRPIIPSTARPRAGTRPSGPLGCAIPTNWPCSRELAAFSSTTWAAAALRN
jgi:glucose/arabinose dehydrogenase